MVKRACLYIFIPLLLVENAHAWQNALEVRTPEPDVKVYIDGTYVGSTERKLDFNLFRIENIAPGKHHLQCRHPDYEPYYAIVQVPEKGTILQEVKFADSKVEKEAIEKAKGTQIRKSGSVDVMSRPTKAYVELNASEKGQTDIKYKNVPIGQHTVAVYFDRTQPGQFLEISFELEENERLTVLADFVAGTITVNKKYTLNVNSEPQSTIFINQIKHGDSPRSIKLESGIYELRLERKDFEPYATTLTLNKNAFVNVVLQKKQTYSGLEIASDELISAETVSIDGREVGVTPLPRFPITTGKHSITIGVRTRSYIFGDNKNYRIIPKNPLPTQFEKDAPTASSLPAEPKYLPETMRSERDLNFMERVDSINWGTLSLYSALAGLVVGGLSGGLGFLIGTGIAGIQMPLLFTIFCVYAPCVFVPACGISGCIVGIAGASTLYVVAISGKKLVDVNNEENIEINRHNKSLWLEKVRKIQESDKRKREIWEKESAERQKKIAELNRSRDSWEFIELDK